MRILFFAQLRDVVGGGEMTLPPTPLDEEGLWQSLIAAKPGLARFRASVRLAKNSEYVGPEAIFSGDDEVALIPPVSGG